MRKFIQCYWPPFFVIALVCLAALLNGCAEPQTEQLAAPSDDNNVLVVGTLADANDPYGMAAAPVITKATLVRLSTLRALKRGRIDVDTAKELQSCADNVINSVNAAAYAKNLDDIKAADKLAATCQNLLDKAKEQKT